MVAHFKLQVKKLQVFLIAPFQKLVIKMCGEFLSCEHYAAWQLRFRRMLPGLALTLLDVIMIL